MSEITKLYENAGVDYEERYNNCTLNKEGECKLKCSCDICKYSEEIYIYPLFTAEKQLDLIKKSDIETLDQAIFESNCTEELIQSITYYLIRCNL